MTALESQILALCTGSMSATRLVDETSAPRGLILDLLRSLALAGQLRNDGSTSRPRWCRADLPKQALKRKPPACKPKAPAAIIPTTDWAAVRERERQAEEREIRLTLAAVLDGGTRREIHRRRYPTTGAMRIPGAERYPADGTRRRLLELADRGLVRLDGDTYTTTNNTTETK